MGDRVFEQPEPPRAAELARLGGLAISSRRQGSVHTLSLAGELDLATAGAVEEALAHAEATDAKSIVVDLSAVSFIDSTGVRLVLCAHARSLRSGDRVTLRRGPRAVQRVFAISGVEEQLPFAD